MTYVIAEIGQNHNGSAAFAKNLIQMAAMPIMDHAFDRQLPGVDAVKVTKRDLDHEGTREYMERPYESKHSFGATYREHREALELTYTEHAELYRYAKDHGLEFVETVCHSNCLRLLDYFEPDALKVASRDLTNGPLLEAIAETSVPVIISTGMATERELFEAVSILGQDDLTIMHCVSQYPADYCALNLQTVAWLREKYSRCRIGYSDHSRGIMAPVVAVALGAEVIEKHITLSRSMKGSDHYCSLTPEGLWRMVRDIRNAERALGEWGMRREEGVRGARRKLERSLAARRTITPGEYVTADDVELLSPGDGYGWPERDRVIGRVARRTIEAHTLIRPEHVGLEF